MRKFFDFYLQDVEKKDYKIRQLGCRLLGWNVFGVKRSVFGVVLP
jgi:hypothetical protein